MKGVPVAITRKKLSRAHQECAEFRSLSDPAPRIPLSVYREQIAAERREQRRQRHLQQLRQKTEADQNFEERPWDKRRLDYLLATGRQDQAVAEGLIPASAKSGD